MIRTSSGGRTRWWAVGLGLVATLASACAGGGSPASTATGEPIPVGAICDRTGMSNYSGTCEAAKAYFDLVNSQGGINGRPIEYTVEDGASSASTTAQVGTRLIDQTGVVALIGGGHTYQCTQLGSQLAAAGVYAIDGLAADAACWTTPYVTPVNNGPFLSGAVAMYFLQTELGGSDVCTMWPNTGQSLAPLDNLTAVVGSMTGHRLRKALLWSGGDLTPIVSGAKQNACKAVILGGSEATYVSTMRTAGDQGMTDGSVVWLGMTTGYTRNVATAVGQVSGYWTNSEFLPWSLDDPALQEFKDLQEDAGFTLDSTAEGGYLAAKLFVTALRSIDGPVDRESVGKAMSSMKDVPTDGLTAQPFSWGRYNTSSQFLQLKDGRWEPHGGAQGAWYTLPATDDQVRSILTTR